MSAGADEVQVADTIRRAIAPEGEGDDGDDAENLPAVDYAAIDAAQAALPLKRIRSVMILTGTKVPGSRSGRGVLRQAEELLAVMQAIVAIVALNEWSLPQHAPSLGRLWAASILRQADVTSGAHLVAINLGLKTIPVDRRRHRDRRTRLLAIAHGGTVTLTEHRSQCGIWRDDQICT